MSQELFAAYTFPADVYSGLVFQRKLSFRIAKPSADRSGMQGSKRVAAGYSAPYS